VFFARVLHNLANFENAGKGEYLSRALADAFAVLKPGGIFAVVQHQARDEMSDEWASGTHGYLKKSFVISRAEAAGFELVAETDINQNDRDQPTSEDIVWRLPPNFFTSAEDEALKAKYMEIGESNRMTLKFRKPL
jgi:predicted methyltransferase